MMTLEQELEAPSAVDLVWRALADGTRRAILDTLALRPHTTGELAERFRPLCRTNVMKHLEMLVEANLVLVRREGRIRWNFLNPVPIQRVCDRWVSRHVRHMASAMARLKDYVEGAEPEPRSGTTAASTGGVRKEKK